MHTMGRKQSTLAGCRIALTCSGLSHVRRGVETWSREAFEALQAQGVPVTLFKGSGAPSAALGTSPEVHTNGLRNGLPAVRVLPCVRRGSPLSNALARTMPPFAWRLGLGSAYQAEQTTFALSLLAAGIGRFDLVHTKDPQVASLLQWARTAGVSRARVILNHGTEEPPAFLQRFEYLQHLAPFHLQEALEQGVRVRQQFVVPNFVDTQRFQPGSGAAVRRELHIPAEAFVVACVAAIKRHHKRLDWLIREVAAVPEAYLLIAGAPTQQTPELMRMAAELLGPRVRFVTDRPHERMPELYRAADVFALCSLKEMLSNAVLEALASGVPCVVSAHPVNRWAVADGGEAVDMEQSGAVAAALRRLQDATRRRAAAERARQRAVSGFSTEVVIAQQVAMYHEVLRGEAACRRS